MAKMFKIKPTALDLTKKDTQSKNNVDLTGTISKGKGKMPSYKDKLSDVDVVSILEFIRSIPAKK